MQPTILGQCRITAIEAPIQKGQRGGGGGENKKNTAIPKTHQAPTARLLIRAQAYYSGNDSLQLLILPSELLISPFE